MSSPSTEKKPSSESLASQERRLRERCAAEGFTDIEVADEGAGRSAYGDGGRDRPVWNDLVSSVVEGDVVMAVETSRFARDTEDGLGQIRRIRRAGGHVVTLDGNDTRQGSSSLPLTVRLAVAEEESRLKSERLLRARDRARRDGKWTGSKVTYGHRVDDEGRLELDPETAPILRRIVDLTLGGMSGSKIARTLNEEGIAGPGSRGEWRQNAVSGLVRSPLLAGYYPKRGGSYYLDDAGEPLIACREPLLTEAEREELMDALRSRSMVRSDGRRGSRQSLKLLTTVLKCGRCGEPLRATGDSYRCTATVGGGMCPGVSVTRALADEEISNRVLRYLGRLDPQDSDDLAILDDVAQRWIGRPADENTEENDRLAREISVVEARLSDLDTAHYVDGDFAGQEERYRELRSTMVRKIERLRSEMTEQVEVDISPLLNIVESAEAWRRADSADLRDLVGTVIESIVVAPAERQGERFNADRLAVRWR